MNSDSRTICASCGTSVDAIPKQFHFQVLSVGLFHPDGDTAPFPVVDGERRELFERSN